MQYLGRVQEKNISTPTTFPFSILVKEQHLLISICYLGFTFNKETYINKNNTCKQKVLENLANLNRTDGQVGLFLSGKVMLKEVSYCFTQLSGE